MSNLDKLNKFYRALLPHVGMKEVDGSIVRKFNSSPVMVLKKQLVLPTPKYSRDCDDYQIFHPLQEDSMLAPSAVMRAIGREMSTYYSHLLMDAIAKYTEGYITITGVGAEAALHRVLKGENADLNATDVKKIKKLVEKATLLKCILFVPRKSDTGCEWVVESPMLDQIEDSLETPGAKSLNGITMTARALRSLQTILNVVVDTRKVKKYDVGTSYPYTRGAIHMGNYVMRNVSKLIEVSLKTKAEKRKFKKFSNFSAKKLDNDNILRMVGSVSSSGNKGSLTAEEARVAAANKAEIPEPVNMPMNQPTRIVHDTTVKESDVDVDNYAWNKAAVPAQVPAVAGYGTQPAAPSGYGWSNQQPAMAPGMTQQQLQQQMMIQQQMANQAMAKQTPGYNWAGQQPSMAPGTMPQLTPQQVQQQMMTQVQQVMNMGGTAPTSSYSWNGPTSSPAQVSPVQPFNNGMFINSPR